MFHKAATQKYTKQPSLTWILLRASLSFSVARQIIRNMQMMAPENPVPAKNMATYSLPRMLAIASELFC